MYLYMYREMQLAVAPHTLIQLAQRSFDAFVISKFYIYTRVCVCFLFSKIILLNPTNF